MDQVTYTSKIMRDQTIKPKHKPNYKADLTYFKADLSRDLFDQERKEFLDLHPEARYIGGNQFCKIEKKS